MKPAQPSPSAEAHELWRITSAAALALVDEHLGPPESWSASALLEYRLSAEFQADWKTEVGHWLHAATSCGGLRRMLPPLLGERDRRARNANRDGTDPRHLKLHPHLAAAMACHYFTGIGWSCAGFDTETGAQIDVDLALNAPDGALVELQVKAPDRPGRLENGRYEDGDFDNRVVEALDHAVAQLPTRARSTAMVAIYAQRSFSLAGDPGCVKMRVFGPTTQNDAAIFIRHADRGQFLTGLWNHIAGVVILDFSRTADFVVNGGEAQVVNRTAYPCTVLLNSNADRPANPDWFPRESGGRFGRRYVPMASR